MAAGFKLLAPAISAANSASRRYQSVNNLKQIGLAFHNYHAANNRFPAPVLYGGASGKVPYSWRIAILPYLDQSDLYKRYNFDEPWDGPTNRKLLELMPSVYSYPNPDGSPARGPDTAYFVFSGDGTALSPSANAQGGAPGAPGGGAGGVTNIPPGNRQESLRPGLMDFIDGTSNTILAVEANRGIPWTKPEDIPFDPHGAVARTGRFDSTRFQRAFRRRIGAVHLEERESDGTEGPDYAGRQ